MAYDIPSLGRLQVVDLRDVWPSEPYSFTPWLAQSDNLAFLAETLGLPGLELIRTEHAVDSFSADIVARIIDTEHHVLIENQLERTDHIHLGQLLTYAPRFDAKVIIWVASQFTEAHRAALDWLNSITDERYAFFGVEAQAVRIGDSVPAPQFKLIAQPNSWTRPTLAATSGDEALSERALSNIDYWDAFHKAAVAAGAPARKSEKPLKDTNYWVDLGAGTHAYLVAWRSHAQKPNVGVFLGLYGDPAPFVSERLLAERTAYEDRYGAPLDWMPKGDHKVIDRLTPALPNDRADWPRQHEWMIDCLKRMETVFAEPVRRLIGEYKSAVSGQSTQDVTESQGI